MQSHYTSTICMLLIVLIATVLSIDVARSEVSPSYPIEQQSSVTFQLIELDTCYTAPTITQKPAQGCCKPGGSCFEKQCCVHLPSMGSALLGVGLHLSLPPLYTYNTTPYVALYSNADSRSRYRPPIFQS